MIQVLHELIDAVADLKGISGNQQADLHARLDQETADPAETSAKAKAASAVAATLAKPDGAA